MRKCYLVMRRRHAGTVAAIPVLGQAEHLANYDGLQDLNRGWNHFYVGKIAELL